MPVIKNLDKMEVNPKNPLLKSNRTCFGIEEVDILLKGGFEKPKNILVLNNTKKEKFTFLCQIIASNISLKTPIFIVTSEESPEFIIKRLSKISKEFENFNSSKLFFVDCYSKWVNGTPLKGKNISTIDGPNSINEISLTLNKILRGKDMDNPLFIIYSLSTFFLYNDENSFFKFLQTFNGKTKSVGASSIQFIDDDMHSEKTMITAKYLVDEYIELKKNKETKNLSIKISNMDIEVPLKIKIGRDLLEVV